MKDVHSIQVWQLSEANKGTKVEISAPTEEHNHRLPLTNSLKSSDCAELTDTSAVSALVSSGSKSY